MTPDDNLRQRQQTMGQVEQTAFNPMTDAEFALWSIQYLPLVRREMRRMWAIDEYAYVQAGSPYGASAADEMTWLFDLLAAYQGQQKDWTTRMTAWIWQTAQDRSNMPQQDLTSIPRPRPLSDFATRRLRVTLTTEVTDDE